MNYCTSTRSCRPRRSFRRAGLTAGLAACLALAPLAAGEPAAAQDTEGELPVARIVIYNAGVSFYEHAGDVVGDSEVTLEFNVDDINDLLKSMVVRDLAGGTVASVGYESQEPIEHILGRFAVDLTGQPTMAGLLQQVRGEEVEIFAPERMLGTIVGIEQRPRGEGETVVQVDYLTLLTEEGLRSVALESVGRIRFTNQRLADEMRQALAALAQSHATDKKTVSVRFAGEGQRPVRISYVQESPVWKTTYRLVLDDEGNALLQGWAIVENTTEADWEEVDLTLVSGRPISFIMDLYQPLYAQRPVVAPPQFAMLMPRTYGQRLAGRGEDRVLRDQVTEGELLYGFGGGGFGGAPQTAARSGADYDDYESAEEETRQSLERLAESVQAAAQGGEVGELFQYRIDMPVSISRGQSAMLPIVQETITAEKLAIYNPGVHSVHPLDGLRLTNTTEMHLMAGPITVFDGGAYAGEAQITSLAAGEERLVSYAMDLETEVSPESKSSPAELVSVRIERGVVTIRQHLEQTITYTVKNSAEEVRELLIERPIDPNWELVEPAEPEETTRDMYRFAVSVPGGETGELVIRLQRDVRETVAITNLNDQLVALFLSAEVVSDEVKAALRQVAERKTHIADLGRQRAELERQINVIEREQNRIRQNMEALARDTDLYRSYVETFTGQEAEMGRLQGELSETIAQCETAERELEEYISNLTLE